MSEAKRSGWKITVASWGTIYAQGTEVQAEEWRRHKASWEGSVARKEPCDELPSDEEWNDLDELIGTHEEVVSYALEADGE